MEIVKIEKGMGGLDACLAQVKSVFIDSVLRFKPLLKDRPYRPMVEADIEKELKEAVGKPGEHALFAGVEQAGGKKEVVAVSHVLFGGEIPKGQVLVRWIGASKAGLKNEDKGNHFLELIAGKKAKAGGRGDLLLEHIIAHYKRSYEIIFTEVPEDGKPAIEFFLEHNFKKAGAGKSGFVRLERKL